MSFRIEKKLFIKKQQLTEFKEFLFKKDVKQIYKPRIVESIYLLKHAWHNIGKMYNIAIVTGIFKWGPYNELTS